MNVEDIRNTHLAERIADAIAVGGYPKSNYDLQVEFIRGEIAAHLDTMGLAILNRRLADQE